MELLKYNTLHKELILGLAIVNFVYDCGWPYPKHSLLLLFYKAFHRFGRTHLDDRWWLDFRFKPISTSAPAAPKNDTWLKSDQKWLEK